MMNVNSAAGLNPALLNPLDTGSAAAPPAGVKQLDAAQLLSKGTVGDKLASMGLTPPSIGSGSPDASKALGGLEQGVQTDIYAVMALFQKLAQDQRNAARADRAAAMDAQVQTLMSAADKIRDAAAERFAGAMAAGAFQIAGGIMQVGMGAGAIGATVKSVNMTTTSSPLTAAQTKFQSGLDSFASNASGLGQGASGIMGGIGSMAQAGFDRAASAKDAERAELEASAKVFESGVQQANDLMQQMMDVIRDVRDKLGAIEQSRIETNRGIARNV
ncbi:type III secretion system translocon subunit SctB [Pseudomonadota bacterium AL_CKDN230030165-1A_HGKHYDSX7]